MIMKTYTKPEIKELNYRMMSLVCLSIDDEETDEALSNTRRDQGNSSDSKDPWRNGL